MVDGLCPNRKSRIEAREFAKVFQVIYFFLIFVVFSYIITHVYLQIVCMLFNQCILFPSNF